LRDLRILASVQRKKSTDLTAEMLTEFNPESVLQFAQDIERADDRCAAYINAYAAVRGISDDDAIKQIFAGEQEDTQ
jgi:hypothetical protein